MNRKLILLAGAAMLGLAGTQDAAANPYGDDRRGIYLSYANGPAEDRNITRSPKLKVSFGAEPFEMVMDTGSTGILVSARQIPNIDTLPTLGAGKLTYTSSGRIMIGRWVTTPVTIIGANGARARTAPIPVLAVTRIECTSWARRCMPTNEPHGVSMMGVGFGREHDSQTQSGPDKNPFLHIEHIATAGHAGESANGMHRGYIVTRRGVHIGLTGANTRGAFGYVPLKRKPDDRDWTGTPACMSVNGKPAACGTMLVDTGITTMFLTVPEQQVADALRRGIARSLTLTAGTRVAISAGTTDAPHAAYSFVVGNRGNPLAPDRLTFIRRDQSPFVNTGVHFLNGFDYLFDDQDGRVGFRWTGHAPAQAGHVSASHDGDGRGQTQGLR